MAIISKALDWLSSDLALLAYGWFTVMAIALGSAAYSLTMRGALRDFAPDYLYEAKRGRPCTTKECRTREASRLRSVRSHKLLSVSRTLFILVLVGAVIPGACLGVLVLYQPFFMSGMAPALLDASGPVAPESVEPWPLIMFLFGNSLWGAVVEINTGLPLTGVQIEADRYGLNSGNVLFANLATAYKFWTAPLIGLVALTLTRAVTGWRLVDQRVSAITGGGNLSGV